MTRRMKTILTAGALATAFVLSPLSEAGFSTPAQASEIRYIVNNLPVTSYDIARRAAFLRLQRRSGNLNSMAADEMVDQALRLFFDCFAPAVRVGEPGDGAASSNCTIGRPFCRFIRA